MKTHHLYLTVTTVVSLLFAQACASESTPNDESEHYLDEYQEKLEEFQEIVTKTSCAIYENAYDGENVDVEAMLDILSACNPTGYEKKDAFHIIATKSDEEDPWSFLTERQQQLMRTALDMAENSYVDYDLLYSYCDELDTSEGLEIALAFSIIEAVQSGISETDRLVNTKGLSWSSFGCNLATSALSSIYGAWGAAIILGTVTGGAFVVVSSAIAIGGGALLSAGLC